MEDDDPHPSELDLRPNAPAVQAKSSEYRGPEETRSRLAYLLVGAFAGAVFLILLGALWSPRPGVDYPALLASVGGLFAGLTGAVIGFYYRGSRADP
jgi:hypothetical protein